MNYYKCEECTAFCKLEIIESHELEPCYNDNYDNVANWQPITKEEFLKEVNDGK